MQKNRSVKSFEDLYVWQLAIELVKQVYILTDEGKLKKDFGLKDQMRRSSVSVPTNVAEGFERFSKKEYLLFLNIAKGSAGELRSLFRVAREVNYIDDLTHRELQALVRKLSACLYKQMSAIRASI